MANPWFRLYAEFANDPKVQMMSEAMQRRYLMLMCMRCSNDLVTLHDEEVAFQLRITTEEWAETKALFVAKGFIDEDLSLLNWEKRQFKSDSSKDRVAAHRKRKKENNTQSNSEVTPVVTLRVTTANALDTDTDTDKREEPNGSSCPERFANSGQQIDLSEFSIPLVDSTEFRVPEKDIAEWVAAFPAVDVRQQLREMRAWAMANPSRRKTRRGINAFAVRWLAKAQDSPRRSPGIRAVIPASADWTEAAV